MHIGELADRLGLSQRSLRHWDEIGLLTPSGRSDGNFRLYSEADEAKARFVMLMKPLGFSLDEIRTLLSEPRSTRKRDQWRGLVDAKLAELDDAIARATAMKSILQTSRDCDCVDLEECAAVCAPLVAPSYGRRLSGSK